MDEKNRLIELLSDVDMVKLGFDGVHYVEIDYDRAAEYLLANGVIVLPCKIGDMVWAIRDYKGIKQPQEGIVSDMYFTKDLLMSNENFRKFVEWKKKHPHFDGHSKLSNRRKNGRY